MRYLVLFLCCCFYATLQAQTTGAEFAGAGGHCRKEYGGGFEDARLRRLKPLRWFVGVMDQGGGQIGHGNLIYTLHFWISCSGRMAS